MPALPLITHARADAVLAWRDGKPITAAQFLSDARALAARLPVGSRALNLCTDRYYFTVAIAACLLRERCSLLPSTQVPETIRQLHAFAPDMFCITDGSADPGTARELHCPVLHLNPDADPIGTPPAELQDWSVPHIPAQQLAAFIFTSGSTGAPIPHAKSFGALVQSVRAEAPRLPPIDQGGCAILGTVPPQHMYGFESTVLLPLQSGGALCAGRPLFPADIAAALQQLPRPRVLCSTPVHLRALIEAGIALPPLDLVICATAMLSDHLARQIESRYQVPLLEIYGSTETGQIASRRTTLEQSWRLWPDVRLTVQGEHCWAQGGHVAPATQLADVLECIDADRFLLHGRSTDLVNVAGKRSSLAYLSHQLNGIPGVLDGAFFIREDAHASLAGVTRLAAFAVAPRLDAARIIAALRERIDPVFLPRPLMLVERLPRNDTGKLPQQLLHTFASELAAAVPGLFE